MAVTSTWTAADLAAIEAAIVEVGSRGASEVTISGRTVRYTDLSKLLMIRNAMRSDINAQTYGGSTKISFEPATE